MNSLGQATSLEEDGQLTFQDEVFLDYFRHPCASISLLHFKVCTVWRGSLLSLIGVLWDQLSLLILCNYYCYLALVSTQNVDCPFPLTDTAWPAEFFTSAPAVSCLCLLYLIHSFTQTSEFSCKLLSSIKDLPLMAHTLPICVCMEQHKEAYRQVMDLK